MMIVTNDHFLTYDILTQTFKFIGKMSKSNQPSFKSGVVTDTIPLRGQMLSKCSEPFCRL